MCPLLSYLIKSSGRYWYWYGHTHAHTHTQGSDVETHFQYQFTHAFICTYCMQMSAEWPVVVEYGSPLKHQQPHMPGVKPLDLRACSAGWPAPTNSLGMQTEPETRVLTKLGRSI